MSKIQIDPLFELIHSLDKQESRYVQVYIKKNAIGNSSNYLDLYSIFAGETKYTPENLKNKLKVRPYFKSLAVTKHYLYDIVLKALSSYHTSVSTDIELSESIKRATILIQKKLFVQTIRLVKKAIVIAERSENHMRTIELLDLELRALHGLTDVKSVELKSEAAFIRKKEILKKQEQLFYLQKLSYDNYVALKTKWVRAEKTNTGIYKELKVIDEKKLLSSSARIMYYQVMSTYLFSSNDQEGAIHYLEKLDQLFEHNPPMRYEYLNQYVALLNNINLLLFDKNDYSKILLNIEKLRTLKTRSVEQKIRIVERLINVELNVYKNTGEFEKAMPVLEEAKRLLAGTRLGEVYRMLFLFDLSSYYFYFGDYRTALKYMNQFFDQSDSILREDLHKTARILNMMIHYELKNHDYFESLLRSSKRFFKKMGDLDEMEKLFLGFFHKIVILPSPSEQKEEFQKLQNRLIELGKNKLLRTVYFQNFIFLEWTETKTKEKSFQKIISQKHSRKKSGKDF